MVLYARARQQPLPQKVRDLEKEIKMGDVKNFFDSLSEIQKDVFMAALNDMQSSATAERIEKLKAYLAQLKAEIDQINRRREALGHQLGNIESLLKFLDNYTEEFQDSFELTLFRTTLLKLANDLKIEISNLKPEDKLMKKFDVSRKLESLIQRQRLANYLFNEVFEDYSVKEKEKNNA